MQEIITVKIDLETIAATHKVKWVVAFNHDWLINYVDRYGVDRLEEDRIFVICFDTTPLDKINSMLNYRDVVARYPDSHRILDGSLYIGNYSAGDWLRVVHQTLQDMSNPLWEANKERTTPYYEIIAMESGFTYTDEEAQ